MSMIAERIKETTTTTGTGNLTLGGAVSGYRTIASVYTLSPSPSNKPNYSLFNYSITHTTSGTEWECGEGYVNGSSALVRNKVIGSSAGGGSHTSFSSGTKHIFVTPLVNSFVPVLYKNSDLGVMDGSGNNLYLKTPAANQVVLMEDSTKRLVLPTILDTVFASNNDCQSFDLTVVNASYAEVKICTPVLVPDGGSASSDSIGVVDSISCKQIGLPSGESVKLSAVYPTSNFGRWVPHGIAQSSLAKYWQEPTIGSEGVFNTETSTVVEAEVSCVGNIAVVGFMGTGGGSYNVKTATLSGSTIGTVSSANVGASTEWLETDYPSRLCFCHEDATYAWFAALYWFDDGAAGYIGLNMFRVTKSSSAVGFGSSVPWDVTGEIPDLQNGTNRQATHLKRALSPDAPVVYQANAGNTRLYGHLYTPSYSSNGSVTALTVSSAVFAAVTNLDSSHIAVSDPHDDGLTYIAYSFGTAPSRTLRVGTVSWVSGTVAYDSIDISIGSDDIKYPQIIPHRYGCTVVYRKGSGNSIYGRWCNPDSGNSVVTNEVVIVTDATVASQIGVGKYNFGSQGASDTGVVVYGATADNVQKINVAFGPTGPFPLGSASVIFDGYTTANTLAAVLTAPVSDKLLMLVKDSQASNGVAGSAIRARAIQDTLA